jgi:hypothetical protein
MSLDFYLLNTDGERIFDANITHNLNKMAMAAGIYKHLWRPEELGITHAREVIEPLRVGLADLKARPDFFREFNSPNGWGLYCHFVPFVEEVLAACEDNPDALIEVSR